MTIINERVSPSLSTASSERLRALVRENRHGRSTGTYAVCSAHPAVLHAAIRQCLDDSSMLHVESTSNQVNQFGGYTGTTPAEFAAMVRRQAQQCGLPASRVLLGADHLGPYCWRAQSAPDAMAHACQLAADSVLAGYQKIHLDASMACAGDPAALPAATVAQRTAQLCRAAEDAWSSLPSGWPAPLYVIGTEVPVPGGEVEEGLRPAPTKLVDMEESLDAFATAFRALGLHSAWERVVAMVVQPGVEFADASIFEYSRPDAAHLVAHLPRNPELVYEAHSTDYQSPVSLRQMVEDHFAILKVGPWLTFAYREAVFALGVMESEIPECRQNASRVREALEARMISEPAHWRPYYHGGQLQQQFARAFSFSDRCRYYWSQAKVQQQVERLLANLSRPLPLALLSQYLPCAYDAIRQGRILNSAPAIICFHIQRVLAVYAAACGHLD